MMKTKLTERGLYMSYIGDLYLEWVQKQEEELLRRIFGTECDFASEEDKTHPNGIGLVGLEVSSLHDFGSKHIGPN